MTSMDRSSFYGAAQRGDMVRPKDDASDSELISSITPDVTMCLRRSHLALGELLCPNTSGDNMTGVLKAVLIVLLMGWMRSAVAQTGVETSVGEETDFMAEEKKFWAQPSDAQAPEQSESAKPAAQNTPPPQPKRILGVMPNFWAVSAGTIPPPPTPKQAFVLATKNSLDYSSFIFVGITSALAEWTNTHPQLGQGMAGYGSYYWRGFVDKVDGNYWVIFLLPTAFHQDTRYYALGTGGIWKRGIYAASRVLITPNYHGHNSFNVSEVLGRGIAQGISLAYYPSGTRTAGAVASKYGWAIGRDMLTNVFREF